MTINDLQIQNLNCRKLSSS